MQYAFKNVVLQAKEMAERKAKEEELERDKQLKEQQMVSFVRLSVW